MKSVEVISNNEWLKNLQKVGTRYNKIFSFILRFSNLLYSQTNCIAERITGRRYQSIFSYLICFSLSLFHMNSFRAGDRKHVQENLFWYLSILDFNKIYFLTKIRRKYNPMNFAPVRIMYIIFRNKIVWKNIGNKLIIASYSH